MTVRQALGQFVGSIGQAFAGKMGGLGAFLGPVFGAIGNLIGGGRRRGIVVEKVIEPITVRPENLSFGVAAHPASAIFGGRWSATGAGFDVNVVMKGDAGQLFEAKVASALHDSLGFEGV